MEGHGTCAGGNQNKNASSGLSFSFDETTNVTWEATSSQSHSILITSQRPGYKLTLLAELGDLCGQDRVGKGMALNSSAFCKQEAAFSV